MSYHTEVFLCVGLLNDMNKSMNSNEYFEATFKKNFTDNFRETGKQVALMHNSGIIHGDLTPFNILLKDKPYIIDFGLSNKTNKPEDHAVDLRLLKEILNSAHAKIMNKAWSNFLKGYKSAVGSSRFNKVTNLVKVIESRGRYANVV